MSATVTTSRMRVNRRLIALILAALTGLAQAAPEAFTEERFRALQKQDALVLVDIHADWCPTCAKQQDILNAYQSGRPDADLHWLKVDFDDQKEWVKHFKAPRQSTLLLYRGDEQIWFSVAETRREKIFERLDEAAGLSP